MGIAVREKYAAGFWSYALGDPACDHPRYEEACATAVEDGWDPWWIRTRQDVEAVLAGCWFDEKAAVRVCKFIEKLVLPKGKWRGKTMVLMDWQRFDAVMPLYGWQIWSDEHERPVRRYVKGCIWIPKKSGKSGLCSSLGLYHLRGDREGAPRVWVASVSHKTAGNIHDVSRQIVHKTPGLYPDLRPIDSTKVITYKKEDGSFVAMSADADVQEGEDWSAGFFDEVHVGIRKLWSSLAGGGAARVQPLMLAASTAGEFDPVSLGWEQWEVSRKIREGALIDIEYFALQYYGDETRWEDWEVIERANPSLGITCGLRYMQGRLNDARASDHGRSDFLRYNLNVWVTATTRWLPMSVWLRCSKVQDDESLAAYLDSLKGQRCHGGLDLSLSDDLTAFVLWFPPCDRFDKPRVWPWFWLPEENILALQDANQAPYVEWARRGLMELTPGNWVDTRRVRERLLKAREEYRIEEVAYDPYKMTELAQALQDEDGFQMVEHPQTIKTMGPPTREVERLIRTGEMEHGNHPILNWMLGNCQLRRTYQDDYQIVKADTKVRYKVDGIVAMIMAADRWIRNPVSALPLVM